MQQLAPHEYDDDYELEHESFPRSLRDWIVRVDDAAHFGERIAPPLASGDDLFLHTFILGVITILTATFLALLSIPGVVVVAHAIGNLSHKFDAPIGPVALPKTDQRSVVLSKDGRVIATLAGAENRIAVSLKKG